MLRRHVLNLESLIDCRRRPANPMNTQRRRSSRSASLTADDAHPAGHQFEEDESEQVGPPALSPDSPLLRQRLDVSDDDEAPDQSRPRRRSSWTAAQTRRAVQLPDRLRSVPAGALHHRQRHHRRDEVYDLYEATAASSPRPPPPTGRNQEPPERRYRSGRAPNSAGAPPSLSETKLFFSSSSHGVLGDDFELPSEQQEQLGRSRGSSFSGERDISTCRS